MATISKRIHLKNNTTGQTMALGRSFTTASNDQDGKVQNIGTVEETIDVSAVSNPGQMFLYNLDSTNYVEVGYATSSYPHKIPALDFGLIPVEPALTTLYAKANTAACDLFWYIESA